MNLPEKSCEIDRLVTHPKLVSMSLNGIKTQQRRDGLYAYPNETFQLEGTEFIITSIERKTLGDMTEADAIAEGYPSLAAYKSLILKMHPGMEWDENHLLWVHHFKQVK